MRLSQLLELYKIILGTNRLTLQRQPTDPPDTIFSSIPTETIAGSPRPTTDRIKNQRPSTAKLHGIHDPTRILRRSLPGIGQDKSEVVHLDAIGQVRNTPEPERREGKLKATKKKKASINIDTSPNLQHLFTD